MRNKGVNQDQDNPLRLLAESKGHTYYFTGIPCVRDHIVKRFSKTGKCVLCCKEDRNRYEKTTKGKDCQRRSDDRRAIRKRGKAYNPSRTWHTRLALYEQLVAAGLPVDPTVRLQHRVQLAWEAYQELTSDDSPSSRATRKLMKRAVKIARKQHDIVVADRKRQEREARRVERIADDAKHAPARAEKRRIRALVKQGREMGLKVCTMRARVYNQGWTWECACSTPVDPFQHNGLADAARAAGLRIGLVESRIYTLGWSREKALTTPVGGALPHNKGVRDPDSLAAQAIAAGITPSAYYNRIHHGWSHESAISTPLNYRLVPVEEQKRRAKVRRDERRALTPVLLCDNGVNRENDKGLAMSKAIRPTTTHVGMFMGARGRPPNLRRNEARDAGLKTYDDFDHPCWCGSETKYTKNAACVACLIEKGKARYAGLEGTALDERKRKDHARYEARIARDNEAKTE